MSAIFITSEGLVNHTIITEDNSSLPIGQWDNGLLCLEMPEFDVAGQWYNAGSWEMQPLSPGGYYNWKDGGWVHDRDRLVVDLKAERTRRLRFGDWTQLPDVTLTGTQVTEWRAYRQALRDLPSLYPDITDISEVVWPVPPA